MYRKIYDSLFEWKQSHLKLLTLFICCFLVVFWRFCIHHPIICSLERSEKSIKQYNEQQRMYQDALIACKNVENSIADKKKVLAEYAQKSISTEAGIFSFIHQAQSCNLTLQQCAVDNEVDKEWYKEINATLGLHGDISHIIKLCNQLNTAAHLIEFKNYSFAHENENKFSFKSTIGIVTVK